MSWVELWVGRAIDCRTGLQLVMDMRNKEGRAREGGRNEKGREKTTQLHQKVV